jgi:hypothetical protein
LPVLQWLYSENTKKNIIYVWRSSRFLGLRKPLKLLQFTGYYCTFSINVGAVRNLVKLRFCINRHVAFVRTRSKKRSQDRQIHLKASLGRCTQLIVLLFLKFAGVTEQTVYLINVWCSPLCGKLYQIHSCIYIQQIYIIIQWQYSHVTYIWGIWRHVSATCYAVKPFRKPGSNK